MKKVVITINPRIVVSPVIKTVFYIDVRTVVKLFDRLIKVIKMKEIPHRPNGHRGY